MSLKSKFNVLRSMANGTRQVTDHGVFWRRPGPWVGGELANRAGLQTARCCWEALRHRPKPSLLPAALREQGRELIDEGVLVIPDFLSDEAFQRVLNEYHQAFEKGAMPGDNRVQTAIDGGALRRNTRYVKAEHPAIAEQLVENQTIWALVSAAVGKRVKYPPGTYFQYEARAENCDQDIEKNIILHEDVHYPTIKVFFFINRNDADNGAFVTVPRSHRFNLKRLRHEYRYSVDIARQRNGKAVSFPLHDSGRMCVHGHAYQAEDLVERQICGEPNTLVIANTMGFHRRGGTFTGTERQQIRLSFRHVETLHHQLFPHFGADKSVQLLNNAYY